MKFTADQFTPTEHADAKAKARFANQFVAFVKSDFTHTKFPNWFYTRLSMTFGHIAHYNQHGFFDTFFSTPKGKVRFIQVCFQHPCYGQPEFTFCDVEKALQEWMREEEITDKYITLLFQDTETRERQQLADLKAKYE